MTGLTSVTGLMGIYMLTLEKLACICSHTGRRDIVRAWSRISSEDLLGTRSFNKNCPQPLLWCAQYRLELDINYLSLWHMQHIISIKNLIPVLSISFFEVLSLVFSFWIFSLGPFWIYFFPYYASYFSTVCEMTLLSSQELTFLCLKNS